MAQGRQRTILVHLLAEVAEDLLCRVVLEKGFKLVPLLRLGLEDEGENFIGEDCPLAVESPRREAGVAVIEEMFLYNGLECGLGVAGNQTRFLFTATEDTRIVALN